MSAVILVTLPNCTIEYETSFPAPTRCMGCSSQISACDFGFAVRPTPVPQGFFTPRAHFCYACGAAIAVTASDMNGATLKLFYVFFLFFFLFFVCFFFAWFVTYVTSIAYTHKKKVHKYP